MDAHAHLVSLGWAGTGYSLDARPYKQKGHRGLAYDPKSVRSTGEGLVKPLLISHRSGRFGVGSKKAHEPASGNQWWLKGFESALNNIGKSESERSTPSGTATPDLSNNNGRHLGLYSFFVRGQQMEGTMNKDGTIRGQKRKSDVLEEDSDKGHVFRKKRESTTEFEQVNAFIGVRDKDIKRESRGTKLEATEEFTRIGQFFAEKDKSEKRKKRKSVQGSAGGDVESEDLKSEKATLSQSETKEERRERRRKRREARAADQATTCQTLKEENEVNLSKKEPAWAAKKNEKRGEKVK